MISEQIPMCKVDSYYKSTPFTPKGRNQLEINIISEDKQDKSNVLENKELQSQEPYKRRVGHMFPNLKLLNSGSVLMPEVVCHSKSESAPSTKKKIIKMLKVFFSSHQWNITILIMSIIFLFQYDIKKLAVPVTNDAIIDGFVVLIFIFCILDFIGSFFRKDKVASKFMFWFDILSLIIIFFDNDTLIYNAFMNITTKDNKNKEYLSYIELSSLDVLVKLFQIFKVIRVGTLYKLVSNAVRHYEKQKIIQKWLDKIEHTKKTKKLTKAISKNNISTMNSQKNEVTHVQSRKNSFIKLNTLILPTPQIENATIVPSTPEKINEKRKKLTKMLSKESKISQKITEGISELMILITFCVLFISIFLEEEFYSNTSFSYRILCQYLNEYENKYNSEIKFNTLLQSLLNGNILETFPIVQVQYHSQILFHNQSFSPNITEDYRYDDLWYIFEDNKPVLLLISRHQITVFTSITNISLYVYVFISIYILSLLIHLDTQKLIFAPLEKMIKVVDVISKDPVNSKSIEELKKNFEQSLHNDKAKKQKDKESVNSEVRVIQSAIIRISSLMAIGFGEAGGEILKENISSSEELNPMLQGKKISAIFGFCFIHHFSDINEALQESTMIFVNSISDIVHSSVDKFGGITNKNLGDCFLLAWKIKDDVNHQRGGNNNNNDKSDLQNNGVDTIFETEKRLAWYADSALLSYLNIIKKINKSQVILAYKTNSKLIDKFGPKYSVQMGFGLHTGWGIEGAIGSFYKIDCSYLSPNVNIAARLETATNIYGVDILFSGEFYDMLSNFMKEYCREIDIVTLKGSAKPVRLYTVDLNKKIREGKKVNKKTRMTLREKRNYYAYKKRKLTHKYQQQSGNVSIAEVYLKQSKGLKQLLRKTKSEAFYSYFGEGFSSYIDGDWEDAYAQFSKAKYLEKNDGPTKVLMNYIKSNKYEAPDDWDGFRALLAKS